MWSSLSQRDLEDIVNFVRVAAEIDQPSPPSSKQIAERLGGGMTPYKIHAAIRRLETKLGVTLLHTAEKIAAATCITEDGRRYLEEIEKFFKWRPDATPTLRLSASHSLVTSNFLTKSLARFRSEYNCIINLQASVSINFENIILGLQRNELDAAVVYSSPDRAKGFPGVVSHPLPTAFQVVLIGTDQEAVDEHVRDKEQLVLRRVSTLPPESQAGVNWLPEPDRGLGGERIIMQTIDAVIACVRARVADFGFVIANYSILEPLRSAKQVFFSAPLRQEAQFGWDDITVRLLGLTGRRSTPMAAKFIGFLETTLAEELPIERFPSGQIQHFRSKTFDDMISSDTDRPSVLTAPKNRVFSPEPAWFELLRWGYYIDYPRGTEHALGATAPAWKWEQVRLRRKQLGISTKKHSFEGEIVNAFGDKFKIDATYLESSLFMVQAVDDVKAIGSVQDFVSVFTVFDDVEGYVFGHWSGTDPSSNDPALFSTIWSTTKLQAPQLRRIAQQMRTRTLLNSDEEFRFGLQPVEQR